MGLSLYDEPPLADWSEIGDESILPEQWFTRPCLDTPEKRLWAAVLQDAILLAGKGSELERAWFEESPGFEWVCQVLNIEPSAARRALRKQWVLADAGQPPVRRHQPQSGTRTKIASRA